MADYSTATSFRERFKLAYERSGIASYSQLSRDAGLSRPVTQKILSGAFDHSAVGPGIFSVKRLANAMGTSVSFLIGEDLATHQNDQAFFNGTDRYKGVVDRLIETHRRGAGRLEAFDTLLEDCDVYAAPDDNAEAPVILRVGKRTLFAGRLGGPFVRDAQKEIDGMSEEVKRDALEFHRRVVREKTAIGHAFLDHKMVTRPARVTASNGRLGLLVEDFEGKRLVLLHAMPIPV